MIKKVNIADGTTWTYSYNAMNQQTGAIETDSSGTTLADESCVFDVFGNRIEETTDTYSGGTITTTQTKFVYTMDGTPYADLEGSGTVENRYVSDVDGPNHWLARVDAGGGGAWLLSDRQGSVTTLVRLDGGAVRDSITYDAFGNITNETDASQGGRIKFQGGEYDSTTGTYLFGQDGRIYNPQTGTWNRPDPIGYAAGQSNLYEAMGNAPTDGTDPTGQFLVAENKGAAAEWSRWLKSKQIEFIAFPLPPRTSWTGSRYDPRWNLYLKSGQDEKIKNALAGVKGINAADLINAVDAKTRETVNLQVDATTWNLTRTTLSEDEKNAVGKDGPTYLGGIFTFENQVRRILENRARYAANVRKYSEKLHGDGTTPRPGDPNYAEYQDKRKKWQRELAYNLALLEGKSEKQAKSDQSFYDALARLEVGFMPGGVDGKDEGVFWSVLNNLAGGFAMARSQVPLAETIKPPVPSGPDVIGGAQTELLGKQGALEPDKKTLN